MLGPLHFKRAGLTGQASEKRKERWRKKEQQVRHRLSFYFRLIEAVYRDIHHAHGSTSNFQNFLTRIALLMRCQVVNKF